MPDVVQQIGDVLVLVAALVATASVVVHATVPWWRTHIGKHLMFYMLSIAAVLDTSAVRVVAGASLDTPWFAVLRLVVFATVPVVLTWRFWIQVRLWQLDHREPSDASR